MRRSFVILTAILLFSLSAGAQTLTSFGDLRRMMDEGMVEVKDNLFIEGITFTPSGYGNIAHNEQIYPTKTATSANSRTSYIENIDGSLGFCIKGTHKALYSKLRIGEKIVANLKGCTLEVTELGMYVIRGFEEDNVLRRMSVGEAGVPKKVKKISELVPEDICTYVTLTDCEFLFKDGAYINIYETYAQKASVNSVANPNGMMDGWASLLVDKEGSSIYFVSNTACNWRRKGDGVPQGSGTVTGVILTDQFQRYSAFPLGYQIRCWDHTFLNMKAPSSYKTIVEWNWNNRESKMMLPDIGNGSLTVQVEGSKPVRGWDYNNPSVEKKDESKRGQKGTVEEGALSIYAPASGFWNWERNEGNGVTIQTSTAGIKSETLMLGFTFGAGDVVNVGYSAHYPCYWKVQCSLDGARWEDVGGDISLRSTPWWYGRKVNGEMYPGSAVAGLGFTDHLVILPSYLLGKDRIYVRIIPSRKNIATFDYTDNDKAALLPGFKKKTVVSFGTITLRYE